MDNQENQDQLSYNSPLKWVIPVLYAIVLGFLFYGLKQVDEKKKIKLEQKQQVNKPKVLNH